MLKIEEVKRRFAADRLRATRKELRRWVKEAGKHVGHRATKVRGCTLAYSASSDKHDQGQRTQQQAADRGEAEWSPIWRATVDDRSDQYVQAVEDVANEAQATGLSIIELPEIDPARLGYLARRVRAATSVGGDWIRLAHIARLSKAALAALAVWYRRAERLGRWPTVIRAVIEVALTKKGGGARLIGVASSLYRLWARLRYNDIKRALETRLARPELAAAPGRGAGAASFEAAFSTEVAAARDRVSATSAIDMSKFYEFIEVSEFAAPARRIGIPHQLTTLAAHVYLGPRRIKVGKAVSRAMFPRRGIVAGCTWCTVLFGSLLFSPWTAFGRNSNPGRILGEWSF